MTMTRLIATLAAALSCAVAPGAHAAPMQVEGQQFDDPLKVGDATLVLNGVGVRAVAWLKGYAAALYLSAPARSTAQAVGAPGAKRLQMRMLVEVPAAEFAKALDKGIQRNTPEPERAALAARQQQFRDAVLALGTLRKGDVVDLDFAPGRGMTMALNGTPRSAALPGDDFYAALLRIFLGPDPVDENLKAGLLGQRAPT